MRTTTPASEMLHRLIVHFPYPQPRIQIIVVRVSFQPVQWFHLLLPLTHPSIVCFVVLRRDLA
jgi:hypothetical protein